MKKSFVISALATVVAFAAGVQTGKPNGLQVANYNTLPYKVELIKAYKAYCQHTEALLDTLDNEYDWVDAFDPQEYYEAKAELDSLINLEK